jgi:hypothetical protein
MIYIAHRINTVEELRNVPTQYGVEVDLRDHGNKIILQHDPFLDGEEFEEYLKHYDHRLIILNIKSERIEARVHELLAKYKVKDYFFLDSTFPMIVAMTQQRERKIAMRFSEYEKLETVLSMSGKVDWVWVDCFSKLPVTKENFSVLKKNGFKLCLVSPELQGRPMEIDFYRKNLEVDGIVFDAVCAKLANIDKWDKKRD